MPAFKTMPETVQRIEVITGVQHRRRFSLEEKLRFVAESNQPGMSVSFVARKHGIVPSLLFHWRRRLAEGGREAVRVDDEVIGAAEARQAKRAGARTGAHPRPQDYGERDSARGARRRTRKKTDLAADLAGRGHWPMTAIA